MPTTLTLRLRRMRLWVPCSALLLLAALTPCCMVGQSESASVSGRITDQQNAVIPNVEVEIRNVDTNSAQVTKTNGDGIYTFPSLRPGNYVMSVRKEQFQTVSVTGVILNVQDNLSRNFVLQVGSSAVSVTVTADQNNIDTTDATVSTVVDRQFAENLPLNGRSFQTLIQLTPGVVLTPVNQNDAGQFSVNGQRATSNYWMVDGVSANIGISAVALPGQGVGGALGSYSASGGTNSLVSIDAMQEFRIQTSTFAPEFGRTPGAQISIVTRSGTNRWHGTVFDYFRNDVLDANDWFADSAGLPKAKERQNDFGGTFSGPILKDRTFFFFSYEGLRLRLPQTALTEVPDLSARQNAVPTMQAYLNAFPAPNGPDNVATGLAQFNSAFSNPGTLDAYSLRIDHKLSRKLNLFGRYNYSPSGLDQRGASGYSLSSVPQSMIHTQTATVGLTWVPSQTLVNDLRFNYSRNAASLSFSLDNFGGAVPLTSFPFPTGFSTQNASVGIAILSLPSRNDLLFDGFDANNVVRQFNLVDSLSVQMGSHTLKLGVDFRRLSPRLNSFDYGQIGIFSSIQQAETGLPLDTSLRNERGVTLGLTDLGSFAQDTWRIVSRLTLTYGLRWDIDFAPSTISGPSFQAVTGFDVGNLSNLALAPAGAPLFSTRYGNVAPRAGVAYQLAQRADWQTVLRGGFGVFYDLATSEVGNILPFFNYPFGAISAVKGLPFPLTGAAAAPPPISPPTPGTGALRAFDPNIQLPYTLQWNVAVEQVLGKQTLSATYIGAAGRRLIQTAQILKPNSNFANVEIVTNGGTSNYDALQLQFDRRLSHGLQTLASYTWSHSIDTASADSLGSMSNALTALNPTLNRGPSDFDIRNAFSVALTYDVPSPSKSNVLVNTILRGWSAENIVQAHSAPPVNVYFDPFAFSDTVGGFLTLVRPNVIPGQTFYLYGSQYPGGKALNPNAFTTGPLDPVTGHPTGQGDLPRNALRGFGFGQWDFAVHRDFPIRESVKLQFRAEMFNVLNHPNFGQPIGDLGSPKALNPQFGKSTQMLGQSLSGASAGVGPGAGGFAPLYQIGGPRSVQLALKVVF